jgi:hypothetical protein
MRKLSCLITGVAALTLLGCPSIDPGDPFDSLTTVSNDDTTGDGDGDQPGDGDGDQPGDGDGDGDQSGDGDGDGECGSFGAACSGETCCDGLTCQANGTCGISGGDGDGDQTGDGDGDLGDCAPSDAWCPVAPACNTGLYLSAVPGYAWCGHTCNVAEMDTSTCPAAPPGTQVVCVGIQGSDDGGCAAFCQPGTNVCPEGAACIEIQMGVGICMYAEPG